MLLSRTAIYRGAPVLLHRVLQHNTQALPTATGRPGRPGDAGTQYIYPQPTPFDPANLGKTARAFVGKGHNTADGLKIESVSNHPPVDGTPTGRCARRPVPERVPEAVPEHTRHSSAHVPSAGREGRKPTRPLPRKPLWLESAPLLPLA